MWSTLNDINEATFWTRIFPRILPVQVQGDAESPLETTTKIEVVVVDPRPPIRP